MADIKASILTVGTSAPPIIFSLQRFKPQYVGFILTKTAECRNTLDEVLKGYPLEKSRFKDEEVEDKPEKIGDLISKFYALYQWIKSPRAGVTIADEEIVCDPTAGRKWMSAGLTIVASSLNLEMFYVDARYPGGKIDPDSMRLVPLGNAFQQTGMIESDRARDLFNAGHYEEAADRFLRLQRSSRTSLQNDLFGGLALVARTLKKWDDFKHYREDLSEDFAAADDHLKRFLNSNHNDDVELFRAKCAELQDLASKLHSLPRPNLLFTVDLVRNAERRMRHGKYDDAVARLYRAMESISQYFLLSDYGINANAPSAGLAKIDPRALDEYRRYKGGEDRIALADGFKLLYLLKHPIGLRVVAKINDDPKRPGDFGRVIYREAVFRRRSDEYDEDKKFTGLELRNQSILAHGFVPIGKNVAEGFLEEVKGILAVSLGDMFETAWRAFEFPILGKSVFQQ